MSASPSLRIEGGFFSPDLLEALIRADLPGQKPQDFGLPPRRALTDEIAAAYNDARALWQVFRNRLKNLPNHEPATSETRTFWVIPFLRLLEYDLEYQQRAFELDGLTFAISHTLKSSPTVQHPVPVHVVGWRQELGRVAPSGRPRLSPHALVQEYLNRSEALWGLVTNGRTLRLLRDSTFVRRQAYVEFDLEMILEENRFSDFVLLYRLLHRTRLPMDGRAEDCWLEKYYQQSLEQGGRVREHLREGVEQSITLLANGFLQHPDSAELREWVKQSGALALYRQLLRLVYRFLFLLVAEERGLMGHNPFYLEHYGISRLRRLCENRYAGTEDTDLWHGLRALWLILQDERMASILDVPPLNGELFAHQELDHAVITNRDLLEAFWHLAFYRENSAPPRRVNYAALDTEELGSVYESLLDYYPVVELDAYNKPHFSFAPGTERKATGSYYTPPQLVSELIRSALEPVIEQKLKEVGSRDASQREKALLSIKVCDPACGSGHFLLAAARRLGKELARIRTGEDEPAPEQVRAAVRDVVAHCIYGVDKNPLAVELARVALWIESHAEGKPLTFLEHRIQCGDSLVGVFDLDVLQSGIPDEAFDPLEGDDKKLAAGLKRQNRAEREGQWSLFQWNLEANLQELASLGDSLAAIPDDSPEQVRRKKQLYDRRCTDPGWLRYKHACDLWTAAFYQQFSPSPTGSPPDGGRRAGGEGVITTDTIRRALAGQSVAPQTLAFATALASEAGFFHWQLEFPEVFAQGGFDCLLGNPPWERIKLQEQEFFANRDARIAQAPNAAVRKRMIAALPQTNPALWREYRLALRRAESASRFLRGSGTYPLTGRGDINTYSVFAERIRNLMNARGRAGIIIPTGIATDDTNKYFFADLVEKGDLVSLFDFDNRAKLFPDVISLMKFCLLTITRDTKRTESMRFAFFCHQVEDLHDTRKLLILTSADLARLNPNTRTLPVFRTRQDAELTLAIYRRVPTLVNERTGENPWGVKFLAMFHMANDSHLFRTRSELEAQGCRLVGNRFVPQPPPLPREEGKGEGIPPLPAEEVRGEGIPPLPVGEGRGEGAYLPLYEAKMIWHYDHRYGTYAGVGDRSSTQLPTPDEADHAAPNFLAQPWYWVPAGEVQARLGAWKRGWLLGFRDITNATNERTAIFSLLPKLGVGHSMPLLFPQSVKPPYVILLLANLTVIVFDYLVRQKLGGVNMTFGYIQQFSVLPPKAYTLEDLRFIVPRVLELTCTAWDMKPFADDVWRECALIPIPPRPLGEGRGEGISPRPVGEGRGEGIPPRLSGEILRRARELRRNATDAEQALWHVLRDRQLSGLKFRRQHPIGRFIVDFYCHEKRLAIELDGGHHAQEEQREYDEDRTAQLAAQGITVLRFWNHEVLNNLEGVLEAILQAAGSLPDMEGNADLRTAILRQWEENARATGGHAWKPPDWVTAYPEIETDPQKGFPLPPFKWNEERRAVLRAELDAYYARLYGLTRKQLRYILDPADLTEKELEDLLDPWEEVADPLDPAGYAARAAASDFPGETFRVLKEKEIRACGEYRTRRLVLEAWERLR